MQNDSLSTTCSHSESNLHRKIVPDVWPNLIRLKDQLGAFATQLGDLADSLQAINKAVFQAQEIVQGVLEHELAKTSHVVASDQSIDKNPMPKNDAEDEVRCTRRL
jgi:hypothetical protein